MKKLISSQSALAQTRSLLGLLLCIASILLAVLTLAPSSAIARSLHHRSSKRVRAVPAVKTPAPSAPTPASGTLDPGHPTITYTDGPLTPNPTGVLGAPDCTAPNSCSDFMVTVSASSLATTHNLTWIVQWTPQNVDQDIFIEDANGNLVANNNSTADPSAIILPIPADGTVYHLIVSASVGTAPLNGSISLTKKFPASPPGAGAPPRYMNYPAAPNQANGDNEPSMGVDWNPNVPGLQVISGQTRLNTGGVGMFTRDTEQWRTNFDDCSSPAINVWENTNAPIVTGLDPIGFVDHFTTQELGLAANPPHTPGRIFALDLGAGTSTAAISDDDGNSWTSLIAGNYPAGPDHETLGGGPFHAPIPTPPAPAYPNAIYYCSQNGVQNAECSRSDDGGVSYGPGVPIFDPTMCGGGIHGHVKVSPQGTVYVPNSSCAVGNPPGANGVAVSTDNGITWTQRTVPGSTGSQDPAIGIGQNTVGKPAGQAANTLYLGWVSADGHAHAAHSPDEGVTWQDDTDISSIIGSNNAVFAAVVAGDDNRAAFAFLGTDPDCPTKKVWHAYIATTYDAGHSWILIDDTPNDPVQIGEVCLLGIGCNGARNLLDFNGIDVDKEGRVLFGYTDGCVNCTNTQDIPQSSDGHGTIARQSGGRRLFKKFDPKEPAPPAAPQVLSAVRESNPPGVVVTWLQPDNGGSPITGYNIYRSDTSGTEMFYDHVDGADTTKYFDPAAPDTSNWFYKIMAVNRIGESSYCHELNVNGLQPSENACQSPFLTVDGAGAAGDLPTDPTSGELTIEKVSMGEPFINCSDKSITFVMKVKTLSPAPPPNSEWQILFDVPATITSDGQAHTLFVEAQTQNTPTVSFDYGYRDTSPTGGGQDTAQCGTALPVIGGSCPVTGTASADGTITIRLDVSQPLSFVALGGTAPLFTATIPKGTKLEHIQGNTYVLVGGSPGGIGGGLIESVSTTPATGTYTTAGNLSCISASPIAGLLAMPLATAPGQLVNFDASSSTDPNPCTTIATYTLDYGDGTRDTQSSPMFSHRYANPGNYPARLTVTDTAGQVSNPVQAVIEVGVGQIQLAGVVSTKVHGPVGPLNFPLPLGSQHGVESRAPGDSADPNIDYKLIFVFPNELTNAQNVTISASATGPLQPDQPTGSPGTDPHQYLVNLTRVPNGQYLTVTLDNLSDSKNLTGSVSATMGVLVGDVNGTGRVDGNDVSAVQGKTRHAPDNTTARLDVNASGFIDGNDVSTVRGSTRTALPGH